MQTKCVPYLHMLCSDPSKYAPDESRLFWSRKTRIIAIRIPCRDKDDATSGISGLYLWCSHFWKSPVLWCLIQKGKQGFLDWNLTVMWEMIMCFQIVLEEGKGSSISNKTEQKQVLLLQMYLEVIHWFYICQIIRSSTHKSYMFDLWNWTKQVHVIAEKINVYINFWQKCLFSIKLALVSHIFYWQTLHVDL